jgi:hypothetical protein
MLILRRISPFRYEADLTGALYNRILDSFNGMVLINVDDLTEQDQNLQYWLRQFLNQFDAYVSRFVPDQNVLNWEWRYHYHNHHKKTLQHSLDMYFHRRAMINHISEELIAAAMHPSRLMKYIDHFDTFEEALEAF